MEVPIMLGYHSDIEQDSIDNINFRNVVYTGANLQLVLMSVQGYMIKGDNFVVAGVVDKNLSALRQFARRIS